MSPAELLRAGLEAVIVAQFATVGALQLATPPRDTPAKLLLAAMAAAMALAMMINALAAVGLLKDWRVLNVFLEIAASPIVFLLVGRLATPNERLSFASLWHLAAPSLGLALALTPRIDGVDLYAALVGGAYVIATAVVFYARRGLFASPRLRELATLLTVWLALLWVFRVACSLEARAGDGYRGGWSYPLILAAIAFLSWRVLYLWLRDPEVLDVVRQRPKYAASPLTDANLSDLERRLRHLIEVERIHRDSEVSLAAVAARVGATPRELSQLANSRFGERFPALINRLRVEEAAQRLAADDAPVTEIMLDVGFGSKSAFQREFRKRWGSNPTDYRAAAR